VEVVVVGDAAGPELEQAVASLRDSRVVYRNLTQRVTVSDDERKHWLVAATMARNEGARVARGRWLVSLDDDDEMRPDFVERLLGLARAESAEVAYGKLRSVGSSGAERDMGEFPPRPNEFGWQAAIYHAGLRFFERELVAAEFATPGDWFMLQRMLRAGVRFAMAPEVVAHYYPRQG
jgi:glycosyltransferase involved in cell wall biosynthesis